MGHALVLLPNLEAFPIFFFCDEAIQPVEFQRLAANNWRSLRPPNEAWPAYFLNVIKFNLSLSVYAQGLAAEIFGTSVGTVRSVTAVAGLTAGVAMAVFLRVGLKLREWWVTAALLAATPCWFLHLRTGFETGLMAVCYAWFLACYSLYRMRHPAWIFPAMLFGAGTFYAYAPGQGVMLATALGLLVVDWRHHRARRRWALAGLGVAALLFVPYVRFRLLHPGMVEQNLRDLESYWLKPWPFWKKLLAFAREYARAFSPLTWFWPGGEPHPRHQPAFHPNFLAVALPFVLLGLAEALRRWREPGIRLLWVALAATPFAAALVQLGITRVLAMVLPIAALAALGWEFLARRLTTPEWRGILRDGALTGCLLLALNVRLDCLALGPQWSHDYGLDGMQWGAQAIFRDALPRLAPTLPPGGRIIVSHTWANNPDVFAPFFGWGPIPPHAPRRVEFLSFEEVLRSVGKERAIDPRDLLVLTAKEYAEMRAHAAVEGWIPRERIRWPDGRVGFHAGHLRLRADAAEVIAEQHRARRWPVVSEVIVAGRRAQASMAGLERGTAARLLSGDPRYWTRTLPDVPLSFRLRFEQLAPLRRVAVRHWEPADLVVRITVRRAGQVVGEFHRQYREEEGEPPGNRSEWLAPEKRVDADEIEISLEVPSGTGHAHLRGIEIDLGD